MKKFVFISVYMALLLLFSPSSAEAQNAGGSDHQIESGFGVTGGLNVAKIIGEELDYETRMGIMLGFYYRMMLMNGPLGLQPELIFNQMGATYDGSDYKTLLDYITLNIFLMYYIQSSGKITPVFGLGPYLSYLVAAKDKYDDETIDIKDGIRDTDLGLALKAGIVMKRLELGLRLMYGFTGIFEGSEDYKIRNFVIGLYIAYNLSGRG